MKLLFELEIKQIDSRNTWLFARTAGRHPVDEPFEDPYTKQQWNIIGPPCKY